MQKEIYHINDQVYNEKNLAVFNEYFRSYLKDIDKNTPCIDLGCGNGNFLNFLKELKFKNVEGVDQCDISIKECINRFPMYIFHHDDVISFLQKRDKKYGVISMFSVIEHMDKNKLIELFSKIKDLLHPEYGLFLFSTPNAESFLGSASRYADFDHTIGLTESSLIQIFERAGLKKYIFIKHKYAGNNIIKRFISSIYRPIVLKIINLFLRSLALCPPHNPDSILFGVCKK